MAIDLSDDIGVRAELAPQVPVSEGLALRRAQFLQCRARYRGSGLLGHPLSRGYHGLTSVPSTSRDAIHLYGIVATSKLKGGAAFMLT